MPAFTLQATADGTNNEWTLVGTTKWQAMADSSDLTYISQGPTVARQSFVTEDLPADAESVTAPVVCNCRGKDVSSTSDLCYSHFRTEMGANYEDATGWDFSTSIGDYTRNWDLSPGGSPWTVAVLNSSEMGVARLVGTNFTMIVYEYNLTGNYVPFGATYIAIWSALLPLLGAGITLAHLPRIAAEMTRRPLAPGIGRVWFRPDEYVAALESLHAWRRPVFVFV